MSAGMSNTLMRNEQPGAGSVDRLAISCTSASRVSVSDSSTPGVNTSRRRHASWWPGWRCPARRRWTPGARTRGGSPSCAPGGSCAPHRRTSSTPTPLANGSHATSAGTQRWTASYVMVLAVWTRKQLLSFYRVRTGEQRAEADDRRRRRHFRQASHQLQSRYETFMS